ncbi:MAG: thymidylate synthase [Methylobacter sp.]
MIKQFEGDTADEIWRQAAQSLIFEGDSQHQESRLGSVKEYLHCCLHLRDPLQRWVLSRKPAINPAFAIAELIWILQGRDDAAFLNYWNPVLPKFSGHDETYYGAYGLRLRTGLGFDQFDRAYQVLAKNPNSRQVVLQIWDGQKDMPDQDGLSRSEDIPCNIVAMPKVRDGKLEWMQVMRGNDLFLGTPHNFVQFTSLQEIMAGWLGLGVGSFVLVSDSLHVYEHDLEKLKITKTIPYAPNTDSLALSKDEYDHVLRTIGNIMEELRSDLLSPVRFTQLINGTNFPISWRNLLLIVAADAARRRGWVAEMESAASQCTNPALNVAWEAWLERCLLNTH